MVLSPISAAESGITPFNFLYLLSIRNFSYFFIGYLATSKIIKHAIIAGKIENRHQIIWRTDSSLVIVITVSPVSGLVPETKPATPRSKATRDPEMAEPNFCDIVPDEKMSPVEEVPFFSVA